MTVKQSVQRLVRIANGTKLAREESGICLVILWHGTIPSYRGHGDHNFPFLILWRSRSLMHVFWDFNPHTSVFQLNVYLNHLYETFHGTFGGGTPAA